MGIELPFVTLDVFTDIRYLGNPLAIVHMNQGVILSTDQKQKIAREFNLSETVFVDDSSDETDEVKIHIYTTTQELRFAGHPTIGTGAHLLGSRPSSSDGSDQELTLITLAGKIPVTYSASGGLTRLEVPHDITLHPNPISRHVVARAVGLQQNVESIIPNIPFSDHRDGVVAVSIVKGLTFALVKLDSLHALSAAKPTGTQLTQDELEREDSNAFLGIYLYCVTEESDVDDGSAVTKKLGIHTRMIAGSLEDPATGSAASCLSSFLTLMSDAEGIHRFIIIQGVEMGRKSNILVDVLPKLDSSKGRAIDKIWLSGRAVQVMKGTVTV
ncbi:putative epimerase [Cantharellus anzutake]|uniref:putative epimerase n=1 Tax=Cantharellus anzutake TaxID=1750568 RepID=UPI001903987E|nr:putative epimerase [Cantharellus anzutake]KAF8331310.1 putative epimerase [Cantharellus anzutake]